MWFTAILTNFISLIAIVGNSFVIFVICREKMASSVYKLIASQCMSDIVYALCRVSYLFVCRQEFSWFGIKTIVPCEILNVTLTSMYSISSLTMSTLAINRFLKIRTKTLTMKSNHDQPSTICGVISLIWFCGILSGWIACVGISLTLFPATSDGHASCYIMFESIYKKYAIFNQRILFVLVSLAVVYCPLVIGSVLYPVIIRRMKKLDNMLNGEEALNQVVVNVSKMNNRKQVIKMLITILISYYVLIMPISILVQYSFVSEKKSLICERDESEFNLQSFLYLIFLMSTCVNPFIICYFNPVFKIRSID